MRKNKIRLGISPFTKKICAGRAKNYDNGSDLFEFTGEFNDVTDDAISTVAELMMHKCGNENTFEFYWKGQGTLKFIKEETKQEVNV